MTDADNFGPQEWTTNLDNPFYGVVVNRKMKKNESLIDNAAKLF